MKEDIKIIVAREVLMFPPSNFCNLPDLTDNITNQVVKYIGQRITELMNDPGVVKNEATLDICEGFTICFGEKKSIQLTSTGDGLVIINPANRGKLLIEPRSTNSVLLIV